MKPKGGGVKGGHSNAFKQGKLGLSSDDAGTRDLDVLPNHESQAMHFKKSTTLSQKGYKWAA